jgi:L-ascorbate metabolism protein UlaG (beta-lactamase superfamily)
MVQRGMASAVTDPFEPADGLPELKLRADVVTLSHDSSQHNYLKAVKSNPVVINGPGEYEVGGVFVIAIQIVPDKSGKKKTRPSMIYVFDFEGITVAHLGKLSAVPSQGQIEHLGTVDVALVPVGGGGALNASQAAEVISLIEPSIVVPMQYKTWSNGPKLSTVKRFLSEMGAGDLEPQDSLSVTKSSLSPETQVVVLEPAS